MSASRKSVQVTSRNGVLMRASVLEKKSLVSCRSQRDKGFVFVTVPIWSPGIGLGWIHGLSRICTKSVNGIVGYVCWFLFLMTVAQVERHLTAKLRNPWTAHPP